MDLAAEWPCAKSVDPIGIHGILEARPISDLILVMGAPAVSLAVLLRDCNSLFISPFVNFYHLFCLVAKLTEPKTKQKKKSS